MKIAIFLKGAALLAAATLLGGCASVRIEPLTADEIVTTSSQDRQAMQQDNQPLQGPLTFENAIARAIKYNLERRTRIMEEALAMGQYEVGRYDMLPKLTASAGYHERNNDLITRSTDSVTGQPSLANPYISSARSYTTNELAFTWSLLDFGQSYYASRQNADRVLIAAERRRKAMHLLVRDVTTAFWRATSAQALKDQVGATIQAAEEAMEDSRKAQAERLRSPLDGLRYRRQLLENLRLLEAINQELSTARIDLASLANLSLAQDFRIAEPQGEPNTRWLDVPVERMEEQAIRRNADLRESHYNARIAREETRRVLVRMFPGLSFSYATKDSSDSYLINKNWTESGVQLSLNLFSLFSLPSQMRLADAGVAVADQRRMATQLTVLTQLHLARLQYGNAYRQYQRADAIARTDLDIAANMARREEAQTQTKLDLVVNQTSAILSQLRRYESLAQVHGAAGKLQASMGLEPVGEDAQQLPLPQLSQAIADALRQWDEGKLPAPPATEEKGS